MAILVKEFVWENVIDAIVGLEGTGVLAGADFRILKDEPSSAREITKVPILIPRDDPFIESSAFRQRTYGGGPGNSRRALREMTYFMHWIYQHVEATQEIDIKLHRPIIRRNMALLWDEIYTRQSDLGAQRVRPVRWSVDSSIKSEITGKNFIGALLTLEIIEFLHQRTD